MLTRKPILAAIALVAPLVFIAVPTTAEQPEHPCNQDAMLVFDASGSMSGDGWGYGSESANTVPRILKVRAALAKVLPGITRYLRVAHIEHRRCPNPRRADAAYRGSCRSGRGARFSTKARADRLAH